MKMSDEERELSMLNEMRRLRDIFREYNEGIQAIGELLPNTSGDFRNGLLAALDAMGYTYDGQTVSEK